MRRASLTFTVRFFVFFGIMSRIISVKFSMPSGAPCEANMSNIGPCCGTSISTSRPSSWPSRRSCLSFSRVRL
jgi:hypothetical protein